MFALVGLALGIHSRKEGKFGGFTLGLAVLFAYYGIMVYFEARTKGVGESELLRSNQADIPLRRYARPEEIAAVAVFLASDSASYVTGAVVPMHGGANPII